MPSIFFRLILIKKSKGSVSIDFRVIGHYGDFMKSIDTDPFDFLTLLILIF